jgi:hypothetical protein
VRFVLFEHARAARGTFGTSCVRFVLLAARDPPGGTK